MIRKEGDRHNQKRSKNYSPSTYVGNNRHMLQEIRDSLNHLRKQEPETCRQDQAMQIKTDLPGCQSSSSTSSTHGPKSSLYRQKALAEIRNSLLPFANVDGLSSAASTVSTVSSTTTSGIGSASGLSNTSGSSSPCQSIEHNGIDRNNSQFDDDSVAIRGLKQSRLQCEASSLDYKLQCDQQQNGLPKHISTGLAPKVIRKSSFEGGGREMTRASPALDGSSTSNTCSDNLSLRSQHVIPPDASKSHLQVSRQYSAGYGMEQPPPPPPPRLQGAPPTPPRGSTAPTTPPPVQTDFRMVQQPFLPANQMQHMLKRISPGPQKNRATQGLNYANGQSQSPTPQRGTSPVSIGRQPMVVQNSLQVQFNYQLQSALYSAQLEPPPPYPIGSANKLASPPPYASNRQSPTQPNSEYHLQKRTSPTIFQPRSLVNAVPTNSAAIATATVNSVPLKPAALQAWNARQPPPIMLSVKSTQVQKPVLQTAVAPVAPPNAPLPPNYVAAVQQKGDVSPTTSNNNGFIASATIPTTDPPSYASTMQAMAAQRGVSSNLNSNFNMQMCTTPVPVSYINNLTCSLDSQLRTSSPSSSSTAESVSSTMSSVQASSSGAKIKCDGCFSASNHVSRKFSVNDVTSVPNHSPECFSHENMSSKETQNGRNSGGDSFSMKTSLQSPIPERKAKKINHNQQNENINEDDVDQDECEDEDEDEDEDDDGCETKVRNYSPQAFKFYMEQHVENVLKSHQQRLHRRCQLEQEMAKVGLSEEAQCEMRKMLHKKESNYIRLKRAKMDKAMFVKIKSIGVGAFGEVALVRKLDTAHLYAMKTLRKADVLKRNQVAHVKAERDILAEADNEWVVKLYYSFQDQENLYFVMDYIPGGDLMSLLIKLGIFKESLARFYIAELVCAVESVHKMGFIHRDIKPDNILIDRDGHIKLTDFGLCTGFRWTHNSKYYQNGDHNRQDSMEPDEKWANECQCKNNSHLKPLERRWRREREHQRCLAHSLVGTPNYIAPEVLLRTGYTQGCDWWSVGVILYEMLIGQPPFLANTPLETQSKVINWEKTLKIPRLANLSPEAKDLILRLCTDYEHRLGKDSSQEVKEHPFFASVDFTNGLRRQPAPITPTIRGPTDTSNFDPVNPDRLRNSESGNSEDVSNMGYDNGKQPDHAFFEFTFRRFFDDGGHAYPTRMGLGTGNGNGSGGGGNGEGDAQGPVYV